MIKRAKTSLGTRNDVNLLYCGHREMVVFNLKGWRKRTEDAQKWNCFSIPNIDIQPKIWVRSQEKKFTGQIRTEFIEDN